MAAQTGNGALGATGGLRIAGGPERQLQARQHPWINRENTTERVAPVKVKAPRRIVVRNILYGSHL
jgi:hypothetical protein